MVGKKSSLLLIKLHMHRVTNTYDIYHELNNIIFILQIGTVGEGFKKLWSGLTAQLKF